MKTIQKRTEQELMSNVQSWIDRTFNFINLCNAEKVFDNMLFEQIVPIHDYSDDSALEFINETDRNKEFKESDFKSYLDFVVEKLENEFEDWLNEKNNENYPMWNTLFEFKHEPSKEILINAKNAGFGVIGKSDFYNTMLFINGAGYSFYGAHWIPIYLELPWIDKSEYLHIEYSHL